MPEEETFVRINPGDKYRPDGDFDLTKTLMWVELEPDEEDIRKIKRTRLWNLPGNETRETLLALAVRYGAPGKHMYLAERHPTEDIASKYLSYSGFFSAVPVNQIPFLREWKYYTARVAHEFDWTLSAHSMEDLSENERWAVQHQMYGLIAAPWIGMHLLEVTDPRELLNGNLLWKIYQGEVETLLKGLCHECEDTAIFARLFAHKANLELFRGALVSGKVHETDRELSPWGLADNIVTQAVAPVGQTPTAEKISQFHRGNRAQFLSALGFYSTDVGSAEQPHSHD